MPPTSASFPTGSTRIDLDGGALLLADADHQRLARVSLADGEVEELVLGTEPDRIVCLGRRVLVTLPAVRSIAEVLLTDGMSLLRVVEVGAEPYGIVAGPDRDRVYVAVSLDNRVVELDADTLEPIRTFPVPDQPKWLAMHPSGASLYVASAMNGRLSRVDLREGEVHEVPLPEAERGLLDADGNEELFELSPRITGDMSVSQDGLLVAVPVTYVDHGSSVSASFDIDLGGGQTAPAANAGYYATGPRFGLTRFNPAIVTLTSGPGGAIRSGGGTALQIVGQVDLSEPPEVSSSDTAEPVRPSTVVRSYLSSVRFTPDDRLILATIGGRAVGHRARDLGGRGGHGRRRDPRHEPGPHVGPRPRRCTGAEPGRVAQHPGRSRQSSLRPRRRPG